MSKHAVAAPAAEDPDSDDAIGKMLASHPGLLDVMRGEADHAISRIRAFYWAPQGFVTWKAATFSERLRAANAPPPPLDRRQDEAVLRRQHAEHFRIYKEAADFFRDFLKRAEAGPSGAGQWHAECERLHQEHEHRKRVGSQQLFIPPPFNPVAFVREAADRGIVFAVTHDERLSATPAGKLTKLDRALIEANTAAIKQIVAGMTEIF